MLGCIAASLGLEAVIGYATPVAFELSVAALGIAAIGFIAHALFVNGPVDELEKLTDELEAEDVPSVLLPVHSAD